MTWLISHRLFLYFKYLVRDQGSSSSSKCVLADPDPFQLQAPLFFCLPQQPDSDSVTQIDPDSHLHQHKVSKLYSNCTKTKYLPHTLKTDFYCQPRVLAILGTLKLHRFRLGDWAGMCLHH